MLLSNISVQTKKDLNCLDSPGLISVWCGNSDRHNNTNCFTSLSNQGVISTPSLVTIYIYIMVVCLCVCVCVCVPACVCVCACIHFDNDFIKYFVGKIFMNGNCS